MDNMRNALLIITSLSALTIPILRYIYSILYKDIIDDYILGIKEPVTKDIIISIIIFILMLFYSLVIYIFFFYPGNPINHDKQTNNINFIGNCILLLFVFLSCMIAFSQFYIKKNLLRIVNNRKLIFVNLIDFILQFSLVLAILGIILSFVLVSENNQNKSNLNFTLYKNGVKIFQSNLEKEIINTQNLSIKVNGIEVAEAKEQESSSVKDDYLLINNKRTIELDNKKELEFSKNDLVIICENDNPIYEGNFGVMDSHALGSLISLIILVLFFWITFIIISGIIMTLHEIRALKNQLIVLITGSIVGKILFKFDDFYVISHADKVCTIAKGDIKMIENVNSQRYVKNENNEKEILKFNQIRYLYELSRWDKWDEFVQKIKSKFDYIKRSVSENVKKVKRWYSKILIKTKIKIFALAIILIWVISHCR